MKFEVVRNDITNMQVDAIVLPANPKLKEGSGVSKRIFDKAGRDDLVAACKKKGKQEVGGAVHTLGFQLDAKYIIHAVVPKWNDKEDENMQLQLLSEAYYSALELADEIGCFSLAIPLLASGNYGFNIENAFLIAKKSIEFFEPDNKLEKVILVVYNKEAMTVLRHYKIKVEEIIDEQYILENDETYEPFAKRTTKKGKEAIKKGVEQIKVHVEDPKNREKLLEGIALAAKIAKDEKTKEIGKKVVIGVKDGAKVAVKFVMKK